MVISKAEMTLAKIDIQMAYHYVRNCHNPKIKSALNVYEQIANEYYLARNLVLSITGHKRLLDGDPFFSALYSYATALSR